MLSVPYCVQHREAGCSVPKIFFNMGNRRGQALEQFVEARRYNPEGSASIPDGLNGIFR